MSKTVTAFGREWRHQQFHGLVKSMVDRGMHVAFYKELNDAYSGVEVMYSCTRSDYVYPTRFVGPTLWLALVAAVENMEESK